MGQGVGWWAYKWMNLGALGAQKRARQKAPSLITRYSLARFLTYSTVCQWRGYHGGGVCGHRGGETGQYAVSCAVGWGMGIVQLGTPEMQETGIRSLSY